MAQKEETLQKLQQLGVAHEVMEHPAVYTMEEMEMLGITAQGEVCKNLFLRDAKGKRHFLVVLKEEKRADLKEIAEQIGSSKLSFASAERLMRYLKVEQGAVSPLGVLNDETHSVEVLIDSDLKDCPKVGVHPNDNTATVWMSAKDLISVIESQGNSVTFLQL